MLSKRFMAGSALFLGVIAVGAAFLQVASGQPQSLSPTGKSGWLNGALQLYFGGYEGFAKSALLLVLGMVFMWLGFDGLADKRDSEAQPSQE